MQVGVIYVLGSRKSEVCKERERKRDNKELEEESDM